MRLLVTGGSGFLGGALVRRAVAAGHAVAVLTRRVQADSGNGVTTVIGSLEALPWDEIAAFEPDTVVHAAWIATPGVYLDSPENADWQRWSEAFAVGLPGVGVRHLTVLGTCIEYAVTGQPLNESTTPLDPRSPYARAKVGLNQALERALAGSGMTLGWARIFYPYGPGEHPARLASSLLARIRSGQPLVLRTPHSTKDYIHEDDVGSALLTLAQDRFEGPVNVGTGEGVTIEAFARLLARLAGRPDLVTLPADPVRDPLDHVVADAGRLRSMGWKPRVALVDGLRRFVESRAG